MMGDFIFLSSLGTPPKQHKALLILFIQHMIIKTKTINPGLYPVATMSQVLSDDIKTFLYQATHPYLSENNDQASCSAFWCSIYI